MKLNTIPILSVTVLLAACETGIEDAQLLVPEDVEVAWDPSFNGVDDGLCAMVPIDVMVYDGTSGEPLHDAALEVRTNDALLVFEDGISPIEPDECPDCAVVWDAYRDQYFLVEDPEENTAIISLETDSSGLAQVYVFVDAFPEVDGDVEPLTVEVTMGLTDASFDLLPL
jgi:hypothetical protein